jgi:hypothetical protein
LREKGEGDVVVENGHYQGCWNFRVKLALGVVLKIREILLREDSLFGNISVLTTTSFGILRETFIPTEARTVFKTIRVIYGVGNLR